MDDRPRNRRRARRRSAEDERRGRAVSGARASRRGVVRRRAVRVRDGDARGATRDDDDDDGDAWGDRRSRDDARVVVVVVVEGEDHGGADGVRQG